MSKPRLLILTSVYPQGKADHFIESEFTNLEKEFNIEVLPLHNLNVESPFFKNYLHLFKLNSGLVNKTSPGLADFIFVLAYCLFHPFVCFRVIASFSSDLFRLFIFNKKNGLLRLIYTKIFRRGRTKKVHYLESIKDLYRSSLTVLFLCSKINSSRIKPNQYDLIYSYWSNELALAFTFLSPKPPIVSRFHGYDLYKERKRLQYFPHRRYFLKKLTKGLFVSNSGKDYLLSNYPFVDQDKLKTNYIGSKPHSIQYSYPPSNAAKILSCSSLTPVKQVHFLIEALSMCDFPIHWTHIGDGPLESELTELAKSKLNKMQTYDFKGFIKHSDIINELTRSASHVFVNSSKSEGLPISILESMSLSIPIIAPDIGGVKEAVQQNKSGLLLSTNFQPAELSQAITVFFQSSDDNKNALSKQSLEIWRAQFNSANCSSSLTQLFLNLI